MIPANRPEAIYCVECGAPFYRVRKDQIFCPDKGCRQAYHQRRLLGGLKLYDLAMRWRIEWPAGALGDLTAAADLLAQDERERRKKRKEKIAAYQTEARAKARERCA